MANQNTGRRRSVMPWLLFSFRGRISRGIYWPAYLFIICVQSVLVAQIAGEETATFHDLAVAIGPFALLGSFVSSLAISVKRLHDMGYSGFLAIATVIPIVNLAFAIWVGLLPGTVGPNPYGETADVAPS